MNDTYKKKNKYLKVIVINICALVIISVFCASSCDVKIKMRLFNLSEFVSA